MATNVELYRRIMERMSDDAEVVAMCRKYVDRADTASSETLARLEQVVSYLGTLDSEALVSAKQVAEGMDCGWNVRKASYYLSRLVREERAEKVVEKGQPTLYRFLG